MPNFLQWDIKYYYKIHCQKQKALGNTPVCYSSFTRRLKKMNLYDAIHNPRTESNVREMKSKTPIQDYQRRIAKLKEENIQFLAFEEMKKVEQKYEKKETPRYNMKPNKLKNLRFRFISIFK